MKLEKYISDLLYRYDLVIVPGFGGIIGRRKQARIDRDTYIFSPPHKDLSFNVQLQQNDGLLVNYIADITGMSYAESLKTINESVQQWQRILQEKKRLKLNQIGIFNLVSDNKILFLPLTTKNYLAESYGLTSFVHKPVVRQPVKPVVKETQVEKTVKPVESVEKETVEAEISLVSSENKPRQLPQNNYKFWKYAAVFVVGLGLFTTGIGMLRHYNNIQDEPVFQKATFVLKQNFPPVKITTSTHKKIHKTESKPEIKKEQVFSSAEKYFIISGAFRNKANAEKKIRMLKKSGYPAKIAGRSKYGLWMVAYKGFATHDEAAKVLSHIKKKDRDVWIYTKK